MTWRRSAPESPQKLHDLILHHEIHYEETGMFDVDLLIIELSAKEDRVVRGIQMTTQYYSFLLRGP